MSFSERDGEIEQIGDAWVGTKAGLREGSQGESKAHGVDSRAVLACFQGREQWEET